MAQLITTTETENLDLPMIVPIFSLAALMWEAGLIVAKK